MLVLTGLGMLMLLGDELVRRHEGEQKYSKGQTLHGSLLKEGAYSAPAWGSNCSGFRSVLSRI
jgi:hypothetical protein